MDQRKQKLLVSCTTAGVVALALSSAALLSSSAEPAQAAAEAPQQQLAEAQPSAAQPERALVQEAERFVGVLLPEQAADVSAQQAGIVRALHVALGEVVKQGQPLVTLDVEQATLDHTRAVAEREAARAALARARIEHSHATLEAERSEQLAHEGLTTHEELAQARFKLKQTLALASEADAHLKERSARAEQLLALRDQGSVTASFRGRVAARYVSPGTLVTAGTPLVRLISDAAMLLRFAVPEHVAELAAGRGVVFVPEERPELSFAASIVRVAPEIDAASRMRVVEALPADPEQLIAHGLVGAIVAVRLQ
ncbi:MAG TPA: efflux RND transporter periplasmic adaptor subunit [Polyangiales bacterium]|nr:efflux RND transporter periplasmic adaptor subunit [Polyangiales bacterium]